ncbi:MAG: PhzF family phenazine biosynthesis protein [Proteobacteria bacterium]|nr:PhzF family phenazine biosynthesis protein [Pseudomonadota bacterium]
MKVDFVTVDVFTDRQFGGNPLAVVFGGETLSTAQMQAISGEFNLAETTFVLPPKDPSHTAEVRIFTPKAELPFAGHPNVGTAFVLAGNGECFGRKIGGRVVFEEKAGLVPIEIVSVDGRVRGARVTSPKPFSRGAEMPVDVVAAAAGLSPSGIVTAHHPPVVASCGAAFTIAELKDLRCLGAASPQTSVFRDHFAPENAGLYLYTREAGADADIRCRMFAPLHGIPEDPATGSANVAFIGLLASLSSEATIARKIVQGVEMGRPSFLDAAAQKTDDGIRTFITGNCAPMMTGRLELRA